MRLEDTRYMQYVAAITGTLTIATQSLYVAWSSPILPKIESGNSPLGNITSEESSWIVSSLALGHIPGSLISGWTVETFGRKGSLMLSGLPLLIPWFVVAFTGSVWLICVSRFIAGIALSNAVSAVTLYNGEIAEKEIRGRLGTTLNAAGLFGEMIAFCIGPYISYTALTLVSSVIPLIFVVVFYFMPESPYYLIKIGKETLAKKNLKRLLSKNVTEDEIDDQLSVIKRSMNKEVSVETSFLEFVIKKEHRKSLLLALGIQTLHQMSGLAAIISYRQTIIQNSKSSISPETSSLICGIAQFPAVFLAAAIVDKIGRKPLMIISALGCGFALVVEGIYFYLQDINHADVSNLSWVPTFGILLYVIIRPIGIGTLTFILMGELFSANIKAHAVAASLFYNNVLSFAVAKSFEPVSDAWGMHIMFALFSVVCILGVFFVYFFVPETKGKTFVEIKECLNR